MIRGRTGSEIVRENPSFVPLCPPKFLLVVHEAICWRVYDVFVRSPSLFYILTVGVEVVFYFHLITLRHTPQSVGLLWTRDRPIAESFTWQHKHSQETKHPYPRWDSNPRSQQALCRRPRGHWDQRLRCVWIKIDGGLTRPWPQTNSFILAEEPEVQREHYVMIWTVHLLSSQFICPRFIWRPFPCFLGLLLSDFPKYAPTKLP
jgi:hypothetical protein